VNGARPGCQAEPLAKDAGDSPVRPAPLTKAADQFGVGLKLALGGVLIGLGEKVGDLVLEVHALALPSTVRHRSGLSGESPVIFGHIRFETGPAAEWTRIHPDNVRVCPSPFGAAHAALDILRLQK
jgi:hypothetical protein